MTIFILELLTYMHFTSYQVVVAFLLLEKILFSFASFCFCFPFYILSCLAFVILTRKLTFFSQLKWK